MSVEEIRQLADRLRKGRLVQQSRVMISAINGLPVEVSAGEVREHAHPDAIAAADAIEWLLSDRHQAEEAMRERAAAVAMNAWHPSYVEGDLSDPSNWKPGSPYDRGQVDACERIAAAIRSIDTRGE